LHIDMDAFFASVEVLDDPSLAGKPVIVGGAGARGVVASCTYEARAYGVHSAMPSVRARQICPEAIFLSGRHSRYAEVSGELHKLLADVTPMVEPIGLDEAFVDVAGAVRLLGPPAHIAEGLRRRVHDQLHLGCAVGIGRSKMIAKLASRAAKPRASRTGLEPGPGVFLVEPADELEFLHGHPVEALWGVGPATATRLHGLGVRTVGDLAALPLDTVVRRLGKASGTHMAALSRGEDPDPVNPNRPNKSIGHEETFSQDLVDPHELERHVLRMAESVATMLRGAASSARTITVKIKFKDLSLVSRSHTMERPITTGGAIGQVAAALLAGVDPGEGIRLLGVSASGLAAAGVDQLSFDLGDGLHEDNESATAREQSWQDATTAIDAIRDRFGRSAVGAASMVTEEGIQVPARRDAPWGPDH
jgi:DNA polymerase-4